ncbi:MAG: RNA methyltransferase [Myxococcota bacterium]|nr:RNA methyltransferase [Myxococcota bacterium]
MNPIRVPDVSDARIAEYRDVRDGPLLAERGLFVAESRLVVQRLLAEARFVVRSLLVSEAAFEALRGDLHGLPAGTPCYVGTPRLLSKVAGYHVHHGCLALVEAAAPADPRALMQQAARPGGRLLVLEGLSDPDNVGGVFRNALGFGVDAVLLSPTGCDPLYRKAVRVSTGATLRIPFARLVDWPRALSELRELGFLLLAATVSEDARDVRAVSAGLAPERPVALLLGAEFSGLSPAAIAQCDHEVTVPTRRGFDSLNVATASGILLFALGGPGCAH